jgi:HSP20 family molecular chaperone IbpA
MARKISVTRIVDETNGNGLDEGFHVLAERIRERAYGIYERGGPANGAALDHWLEAERDLTIRVESDLVETDASFELSLITEGLEAETLSVTACSGALAVSGRNIGGTKVLLSRFDLPGGIDIGEVTALLDNGTLRVLAQKAGVADKRAASREKTAPARSAAA